ncbi:MAG: hypothetical protein GXO77_14980 [Calditrichaeota bacterium]|nr:hypothetical protein [Calditrichota bacterium]
MNKIVVVIFIIMGIVSSITFGQSIKNTVHNLSVSGPGTVKAESETEICIFCHTPHNSRPVAPLWNREDPGTNYTLYNSSTIQATPGQPDGSSILCLSCHDGTIALGSVISRTQDIVMSGGVTTMPPGETNLGTDLSDDHPISFTYDQNLSSADPELVDPATLNGPVYLENDRLQCTSCHDPHKDLYGKFLVATNRSSDLCLYCHQKNGWSQSSHSVSTAQWNGAGSDPWYHTDYTTVSDNACENCHNPHNASGHEFLVNQVAEEDNCLVCHNGNVASKNIESQLSKPYRHDVYKYSQVHDPQESAVSQVRHVECTDCHNPHQAQNRSSNPPDVSGSIQGVKGVDSNGNPVDPVRYQYEICYRCHADSPDKPGSPYTRQIQQTNVRLEFDPNNPSFHPIEAPGQNTNVPSLISPLTESSIIYCTDCHASDGSNSPAGPHGSNYQQLLKYRYETADYTKESYQAYELCYQCHDRNKIINSSMSRYCKDVHRKHIVGEDAPCATCHDPHGISSNQGNSTNNTHLINFNLDIVSPNSKGELKFVDRGYQSGACYLRCHGKEHRPKKY